MSEPPALPVEIHGRIASFVNSSRDLLNYSRISSGLRREIERRLYHNICLRDGQRERFNGFFRGLDHRPYLLLFVHKFTLNLESEMEIEELVPRLGSALAAMTNLKHLHLGIPDFNFGKLEINSFKFQLESLRLRSINYGDRVVGSFLLNQSSITALHVSSCSNTDPLPSTCLPRINVLTCPASLGRRLLPSRSIERLHWTSPSGFTTEYFTSQAPHVSLKVLEVEAEPSVFGLPTTCPNLRYLEIHVTTSVS